MILIQTIQAYSCEAERPIKPSPTANATATPTATATLAPAASIPTASTYTANLLGGLSP